MGSLTFFIYFFDKGDNIIELLTRKQIASISRPWGIPFWNETCFFYSPKTYVSNIKIFFGQLLDCSTFSCSWWLKNNQERREMSLIIEIFFDKTKGLTKVFNSWLCIILEVSGPTFGCTFRPVKLDIKLRIENIFTNMIN